MNDTPEPTPGPTPELSRGLDLETDPALAAAVLDMIDAHVRPGVSTGELDRLCHAFIVDHGAAPAPLN